MEPITTPDSNLILKAPEGHPDVEDLSVLVEFDPEEGVNRVRSTWELTDLEREQITEGATIDLRVWGDRAPPVSLTVEAPFCEGEDCGERMTWKPELAIYSCDHDE